MKLLLFLVAVVALLWLLRGSLATWRGERERGGGPRPPAGPQAMLQCAECGVHLPKGEALTGPGGVFCSEAHRALHASRPRARDSDRRR